MGRESPNFLMSPDGVHPLPDLSSFHMNPFPLATGPDPMVAARLHGLAGVPPSLHPLFAMQNPGAAAASPHLQQLHNAAAAQYMHGKLSVGLFPGYLPHPNGAPHPGLPGGLPAGLPPGAAGLLNPTFMTPASIGVNLPASPPQVSSGHMRFPNDSSPETLDLRKSSIDTLRLKAKEHSAAGTQEPESSPSRSESPEVKVA